MNQDPDRPFTRPDDGPATTPEADRTAGFPRDEALDRQTADRPTQAGPAPAPGGAPQAVDPGLADQEPEGPAGRAAWSRPAATTDRPAGGQGPLDRFRERWPQVQGAFVDDPRNAVAEADRLVAEVIQGVERSLTERRRQIEAQWSGGEPDTERLRQTMHGYREMFHRLLQTDV